KTTLFNSLTKSSEHTGNWHGVTVDVKSKQIKIENQDYEIFDLPGLYSLNTFSYEEKVATDTIIKNLDKKFIYIIDANSIQKNLYLLFQLLSLGVNIKVCINNYDYFKKKGGSIDIKKLSSLIGCECEIVNVIKFKPSKKFLNFSESSNQDKIKFLFNKLGEIEKENSIVNKRYQFINEILTKSNYKQPKEIYGLSKADKYLLKPIIILPLFLISVLAILYSTFFLLGPKLSNLLSLILNNAIKLPVMNFIHNITANSFVIEFFDKGVFSSLFAICSFLPQICILYLFLSVLENSGVISRLAFVFDDALNKIGLNGKIVYTLLMGFGCNTTACWTAKNMSDNNSKTKTALLTPFMSCSAKLPVYIVVATAIFGHFNIFVIFMLYLIGVLVALVLAGVYEKTIFKSKTNNFLIEFPPLKFPNIKTILTTCRHTIIQFLVKIFSIIFSVSVILWLLNNVDLHFKFTTDYTQSILYFISKKICWIFKPIGLGSPAIVSSLLIGLIAKELIVSSMLIFNKVSSSQGLMSSLILSSSPIYFTIPSAISFLIFVLLYSPCLSSLAVIFKEAGVKNGLIGVTLQFLIAYFISMIFYFAFNGLILKTILATIIMVISIYCFFQFAKKIKNIVKSCGKCFSCKKCG
ncbi:MAG: ferrous iron transporter B, partial [Clostridia bacterium]|nr:ferrous iron transporter B [Clostridia bacterium]